MHGKQAALKLDVDRREVEAAAAYMADEDTGIGYLFSGWCQAGLPHKKLADNEGWQIETEGVILVVEPGMRPGAAGRPESVGVPYGSRARLIMLYLQSEALRTGRRDVALGRSLRAWLAKMGIPQGGKSIAVVKDQAERISRCKLSFNILVPGKARGMQQQAIVDKAIFLDPGMDESQGTLFTETATLSQGFFDHLQKDPVPLEEAAIRAINNNSMALDLYAWLAYRLHALNAPKPVSWVAPKKQFGSGFNRIDNFKQTFTENLRLALAVYPGAKVDSGDKGVVMIPSKPPVAPRLVAIPGRVPRVA